jgi:DNA repair exonuclease SbcCD nuclease subunit
MSFLVMSDLHLHNHNVFGSLNENKNNQRLIDGLEAVEKVLEKAIEKQIKYVFCLGDIFQTKINIPVDVISLTVQTFRKFKENGIKLILLVGNHDKFFTDEENSIHSLEIFRDCAIIVDRPQVIRIKGIDFYMMPYMDHKDGMLQILYSMIDQDKEKDRTKILMLHEDIGGLRYDNGTISSAPIKYENLNPSFFNIIYSGHIHLRTEFGRFVYVGSLYQKDFNEEGQDKGCYLLEVFENKLSNTFLPIPSKKFKTVYAFENPLYTRYYYYKIIVDEIDVNKLLTTDLKGYIEGKDYILQIENAVIKEINTGDKEMESNFDLAKLSKNFIKSNDIIFRDTKLSKETIYEILMKLGVM